MSGTALLVVGAGQMGRGIAEVCYAAGYAVGLADLKTELAEAAVEKLRAKVSAPEGASLQAEAWPPAGPLSYAIAIEAAPESEALKREIFALLDKALPAEALLASNTSSISLTSIAAVVKAPERVVGIHFMNPVPRMALVEVIRGVQSNDASVAEALALVEALGKTPVLSKDTPAFIVNRVLVPMALEACFLYEQGVASAEDIDKAVKLGLNHPMGPLTLADFVGLDTLLAISGVLHRELGEDKYRAPVILRRLVAAGRLGRKTGHGFYRYDAEGKKVRT